MLGCGKKGPPLAPLNLVPEAPAQTTGRVAGDTVYLATIVPAKNANGRGTLALDHIEIYAVTVDAGALPPPNRDLMSNAHAIAKIPIQPPVDPDDEDQQASPDDTRPKAGDVIVFAERLTDAQTTPEIKAAAVTAKPEASAAETPSASQPATAAPSTPTVPPLTSSESVPATGAGGGVAGVPAALPTTATEEEEGVETEEGGAGTPAAGASAAASPQSAAAAAAPKAAPTVTRVYVMRGVTKKGRPGTPSTRIVVPIVPPPPPPSGVTADFTETSVKLTWKAPEDTGEAHGAMTYKVYPHSGEAQPAAATVPGLVSVRAALNSQPLDTLSFEHAGAEPGKEQCFVVATVEMVGTTAVESAPSDPACVTPVDRFPPAAPTGLAVVATTGAMNLIWDANQEPDLAGYLVLRGEAPGGTLQPLTPEPIRETRFRDTTAQPGVRYAYAIVAVDRAGNRGAPSARVEETAR